MNSRGMPMRIGEMRETHMLAQGCFSAAAKTYPGYFRALHEVSVLHACIMDRVDSPRLALCACFFSRANRIAIRRLAVHTHTQTLMVVVAGRRAAGVLPRQFERQNRAPIVIVRQMLLSAIKLELSLARCARHVGPVREGAKKATLRGKIAIRNHLSNLFLQSSISG